MHPSSISEFDITKKNSMSLAGFRKKNIKRFVIQYFSSIKDVFEKGHAKKIIQFSEAGVAPNLDINQ